MVKKNLKIYSDGGSRGNPGPAACAFVAQENGKPIYSQYKYLGVATNNVAEYNSILLALKWLSKKTIKSKYKQVTCFLDSELVMKQLSLLFKVKDEKMRSLFYSVKKYEEKIDMPVTYVHVRRDKNKLADFLVNKCLDEKK